MQFTVRDVTRLLSVPEKKVYTWIQQAGLPAVRVDGQYRINRSALLEWATANKIDFSAALLRDAKDTTPLPTLTEGLQSGGIATGLAGKTKEDVIRAVVATLPLPDVQDREFLFDALWARECLQSTGIGDGIAIPHVRNPLILAVDTPMVSLCFLAQPVEFDAIDGKPVHALFTLITPTTRVHLHMLSRLVFALRDPDFKAALERQAPAATIIAAAEAVDAAIRRPAAPPGGPA